MKKDNFGKHIPKIEEVIGYVFRDKSLLKQAFTRTSFSNEAGTVNGAKYQSNEVLEFFGDGVLSVAIISLLLSRCTERYAHGIRTELTEGDFSNIKSKLSDKTNLSRSIAKLGLEKYLLVGEGDAKLGIINEPSVMEDLFESIIGAVYIDSDKSIKTVGGVVERILDMSVYTSDGAHKQSAKNALQEWCADKSRRLPAPVYKTLSEEGPDHKKVYERGVYIGERLIASAKGKNQKAADALAAAAALERLMAKEQGKAEKAPNPSQNTPTRAKKAPPSAKKDSHPEKPAPTGKSGSRDTVGTGVRRPKEANKSEQGSSKSSAREHRESIATASGATAKLKKHAQSKGLASPTFRDLGVIRTHSGKIEYRIECEMSGRRVVGSADSRAAAREMAAQKMAKELKIK